MIFLHYTPQGLKRTSDLTDIFAGQTAMLIGGAPTLNQQPLELLANRGILTMAMNNAALHFQPTLWCGVDHPSCYEPQILLDPRIMKFCNAWHADIALDTRYNNRVYRDMPNTFFFMLEADVPWDEYLAVWRGIPWYNNTLFSAIYLLYHLGIRRLILAGSSFSTGSTGDMYVHSTTLTPLEVKWNTDLYNSQVHELRRLKPVFDRAGLEVYDCSINSRLSQVYQHITFERAIELCLESFPSKPLKSSDLPHCSKFATATIQNNIAQWPGYKLMGKQTTQAKVMGPEHGSLPPGRLL